MIRKAYADIRNRKNDENLSPIEAQILMENLTEADKQQLHRERLRNFLEDIARREGEAEKYGAGEQDWAVAKFYGLLANAEALPFENGETFETLKRHRERRAWRLRLAAKVFRCLREGLSSEEICRKLEISGKEQEQAERELIRQYDRIVNRVEIPYNPSMLQDPRVQTVLRLQACSLRLFSHGDTGVRQYEFYRKDRLLGTASVQVLPDFPLVLQTEGMLFNSSFDRESTIFPGQFRDLVDADDPVTTAARLTWLESGSHSLQLNLGTGTVTYRIVSGGDSHCIFLEDRCVAELVKLPVKQHLSGWELNWCMKEYEPVPDSTAVLLMSFLILQFAP